MTPGLEITVADDGIGINPADQPLIFERFFRVDPARARATGGAGLGLTIARELVQAMHGSIGVRSGPGTGSEFWLRLPLASAKRPLDQLELVTPLAWETVAGR